jgi:hypothetical protein
VIRIGTTTYGKPYGFVPRDNCDITYFSVEFKGANNVGYRGLRRRLRSRPARPPTISLTRSANRTKGGSRSP